MNIEERFQRCSSRLIEIHLPDTLTEIGKQAFFHAEHLKEIFIPRAVGKIGPNAFEGCKRLTIYAQAEARPEGWDVHFAPEDCDIRYGYCK